MTSVGERLRETAHEAHGRWVEVSLLLDEPRFPRTVSDGKSGRGRGKSGGHYEPDDPEEPRSVDHSASEGEPGGGS